MTDSPLKEYLLDQAIEYEQLAHSLHWHLELERNNDSNEPKLKNFYNEMWDDLMKSLEDHSPVVWRAITEGREFKDKMHGVSVFVKEIRGNIASKKPKFREEIRNQSSENCMIDFGPDGITSPLDPSFKYYGVEADMSSIFRSAIQPILFHMKTRCFSTNPEERETQEMPEMQHTGIIFKNGDDLRQDQLILMLFKLMDLLLKEVNLDFKFTCYRCIAVTKEVGFMECVPNSETIQQV